MSEVVGICLDCPKNCQCDINKTLVNDYGQNSCQPYTIGLNLSNISREQTSLPLDVRCKNEKCVGRVVFDKVSGKTFCNKCGLVQRVWDGAIKIEQEHFNSEPIGTIWYPPFSWFYSGPDLVVSSPPAFKKDLPELPKIPKDYKSRRPSWDDGSPNPKPRRRLVLCEECGTKCYFDEHRELVCTSCGLVQDKPFTEQHGLWTKKQCEPVRYHLRAGGTKKSDYRSFTDEDYIKKRLLQCRGKFVYGFTSKHCRHNCKGCNYAIETSLKERESGANHIELFLRYPVICTFTFDNIPCPTTPVSASELSRYYKTGRHFGYPSRSHPTLKKWLTKHQEIIPRIGGVSVIGPDAFVRLSSEYWIDYGSYLTFMFTPLDKMLRKTPIEGAHAVQKLKSLGGKKKSHFEPTRQNLIDLLGESAFNLLIKFKILRGYKQRLDRGFLYFAYPYSYHQYPEMRESYKKYQSEIYKLMNSGSNYIFH
jgi:hypothetical protein